MHMPNADFSCEVVVYQVVFVISSPTDFAVRFNNIQKYVRR